MRLWGWLVLAAVFGSFGAAQAQTGIDSARADGIVDRPLVTNAIDLSAARPQAMPRLDMPINADAMPKPSAAPDTPAKPKVNTHDTGNPAVAPIKWAGLVMNTIS